MTVAHQIANIGNAFAQSHFRHMHHSELERWTAKVIDFSASIAFFLEAMEKCEPDLFKRIFVSGDNRRLMTALFTHVMAEFAI